MPVKLVLDKENRIKKEVARLNKIFVNLDKNKLATVKSLINTAAFYAVSMQELEETINQEGYTQEYKNGANQYGIKESAEAALHIQMTGKLTTIVKQLCELCPVEMRKESKIAALRNRKAKRDAK